jgi:DNA modification methylase
MSIAVRHGDCRTVLPTLPAASVHCVVTSPPYWGLRDYGTATWEGGDPGCDHKQCIGASASSGLKGSLAHKDGRIFTPFRDVCGHCGAIRIDAQLGLEPDFNAYVAAMVAVFREVRRVLRDDGTLWLNLGDSYFGTGKGPTPPTGIHGANGIPYPIHGVYTDPILKSKDLCGIPWRVAFALQADGWYLRQDIIWSKPNPMPESVTDRCTKAHEYLFLLSKRERYYYDQEAIREPFVYAGDVRINTAYAAATGKEPTREYRHLLDTTGRNKRSVWEVTTQPFSEAHFATFPPALIEPCIKAGTSERGCCGKCGKPWVRQVERETSFQGGSGAAGRTAAEVNANGKWAGQQYGTNIKLGPVVSTTTTGWQPSCACAADPVPCTVLDPFGGAGTTGLVADRLQRNAVLIELNPEYADMATQRIRSDAGMFAEIAP